MPLSFFYLRIFSTLLQLLSYRKMKRGVRVNKKHPSWVLFAIDLGLYIIPMPPGMPPPAEDSASGISTTSAPMVAAVDAIDTAF